MSGNIAPLKDDPSYSGPRTSNNGQAISTDCAMIYVKSNIVEHGQQYRPAFWGRLRNDKDMAWVGTVEQLLEFMAWLNSQYNYSIHKDLVFTYDYSKE